jgi:hypothetical protein
LSLLAPGLHDPLRLPCDAFHDAPLADREREGLLAVHILAGLAGMDGLQGVPVIGSADDDGVDLTAFEQLAVIRELLRLPLGSLLDRRGGASEVGAVHIAHGNDIVRHRVHQRTAAAAGADHTDANAASDSRADFRGPAGNVREGDGRRARGGAGALQEFATGEAWLIV